MIYPTAQAKKKWLEGGNPEIEKSSLQFEGENLCEISSTASNVNDRSIPFIGLELDEKLDFKSHMNKIIKKAQKGIFGLSVARLDMNVSTKIKIYHSLVHSHLIQNLLVIGGVSAMLLKKLESVQRKALRIVFNKGRRDDVRPEMRNYKILSLRPRV